MATPEGVKINPTARRVIYTITVLIALVIAGAILFMGMGRSLFLSAIDPAAPFETYTPPPEPDYARTESWAALPFTDDFADFVPARLAPPPVPANMADTFFVHSTTFLSGEGWNAATGHWLASKHAEETSIKHHASAFAGCCHVYAPRYRQATYFATLNEGRDDSRRALDLAYEDVRRAFRTYMARWNQGRPIILAGHGQGARHVLRLLEEEISGSRLRRQLVAAYLVGVGVPLDHIGETLPDLPVCASATQTRCVVGWTSLAEGRDDDRYATQSLRLEDGVYRANANRARLCVNPLSWEPDGTMVTAERNPGALPFTPGLDALPDPVSGVTAARCEQGALRVNTGDAEGFRHVLSEPGDTHYLDYNLFYVSVWQNARDRALAFRQRGGRR